MATKKAFAAGKFYTSIKEELQENINNFQNNHKEDYNITSRLLIAPHAGYIYSGQLAYDTFSYFDKNVSNIFIFAPTHRKSINNVALSTYDEFETPLGNLTVNKIIQNDIIKTFNCEYCDEAFEEEHAIEVQLPFIQHIFKDKNVKIVPILIGNDDADKVFKIISHYYPIKSTAFIISSDLSHYLPHEKAMQIDIITARMIEEKHLQGFRFEQACGAVPVCAATQFALANNYTFIRVGLINSSLATGDKERVVGYGGWLLYEGEKNQFIKEYFSPKLIDIVRKTIYAKLMCKSQINITNYMPYPQVLDSDGACFVTIEIDGKLRGCIGSVLAHSQLIVDLIKNSYNAAFADPRFQPLTMEEYSKIKVSISLMGTPKPMSFKDEDDLLEQLVPDVDGLIIKDQNYQALYLPSVWKQIPDKKAFLYSLKQKAGLNPEHFSDTFEAFRFYSTYIEE